jgi:glycosyltransferase involved in cell wall biosynthesis
MTNTFGNNGSRDPVKCQLSVLVPTLNEEVNLQDCLASVAGWANEIWVVDSYSTDRTPEIARQSEANLMQHPFDGYAAQKNWALENVPFSCEWLLILDADERVSLELADEIRGIIAADGNGYDGFYLNRKLIFYGKWIRHCGWYPSWNLRLFRHMRGRYEQREVHEHLVLEGKVGYCKHDLIHEDLRDMSFCIAKHNRYSTQEARELDMVRRGVGTAGLQASLFKGSVERKRFIKERIWPHLPGRAFLLFFYLYFVRLGFLDGKHGFLFCQMHAIFEQFTTAKLWELEHYKQDAREGTINAARVFRSAVRVDAERSKK